MTKLLRDEGRMEPDRELGALLVGVVKALILALGPRLAGVGLRAALLPRALGFGVADGWAERWRGFWGGRPRGLAAARERGEDSAGLCLAGRPRPRFDLGGRTGLGAVAGVGCCSSSAPAPATVSSITSFAFWVSSIESSSMPGKGVSSFTKPFAVRSSFMVTSPLVIAIVSSASGSSSMFMFTVLVIVRPEGGVFLGRFKEELRPPCGVGSFTDSLNFLFAKELGGGCEKARDGVSGSYLLDGDIGPTDLRGEDPVWVFIGERACGRGNLILLVRLGRRRSVGSVIVASHEFESAKGMRGNAARRPQRSKLTLPNLHSHILSVGAMCTVHTIDIGSRLFG